MRKIVEVIASLDFGDASRLLGRLALGLSSQGMDIQICVLGCAGPEGEKLRAAGITVHEVGWRRMLDLPALGRILGLWQAARPDVIHAWGMDALRWVDLTAGKTTARLIGSGICDSWRTQGPVAILDRWLVKRADVVVAGGPAEAARFQKSGMDPRKIALIRPGVVVSDIEAGPLEPPARHPEAPGQDPYVLCIGLMERPYGFYDAIWTLGLLSFSYPRLHLVLAGEGSDLHRLKAFAHATRVGQRVHFVSPYMNLERWLAHCAVVWAPSQADVGRCGVLDAMSACKPVAAFSVPCIREILGEGGGILVNPGDKVTLARHTHQLLTNSESAHRFADVGRKKARERFAMDEFLNRHRSIYER